MICNAQSSRDFDLTNVGAVSCFVVSILEPWYCLGFFWGPSPALLNLRDPRELVGPQNICVLVI